MKSGEARAWQVPHATLLVYLLAVGIILAVMAYWGQLVSPYLEHDDWNFLLPASWGFGYATPLQKTLTEGRWLNYWWYLAIGVRWSATAAAWAYALFLAAFACALSFHVDGYAKKLLLTLVIFFSPMFAALSLWPAALAASRVLLALAALAFLFPGRRAQPLGLGVATFLAVMAYAGAAPVILLAYVFLRQVERERDLIVTLSIYLVAYALSILCIATLNGIYNDHFGVLIEGWRQPHPAQDLASFWANCLVQLDYLRQSSKFLRWPLLLAAICALVVWRQGQRRLLVSVLAVTVMAFGMELGFSALNGVHVPVRSMCWLWVAIVLIVFLAWDSPRALPARFAQMAALALLALGVMHWGAVYRAHQAAGNTIHAVGAALARVSAGRDVVLVGDVRSILALRQLYNSPQMELRMAWASEFGLQSSSCTGALCDELVDYARDQQVRKLIFPYRDMIVVYFHHGAVFP